MDRTFRRLCLLPIIALIPFSLQGAKFNAYGFKFFTAETEHFRIHYHQGLEHLIPRVGSQCEKLYGIYRNQYGLTLPDKTDLVVIDGDISGGWALAHTNTVTIWTHDFDFNLRGSHDWFEDVITHEYAHIVSIQAGLKLPPAVPEIRIGSFSHPNEKGRVEAFHSIAGDILPPWFTEGIAQYSSMTYGADRWDSHREMILRSLSLSGKLLSWDHMQVFAGKGDDFEKTYNHGFSMVNYIVERYGEDKIAALLRESDKTLRMDFDGAMKAVFGIPARTFYEQWKRHLYTRYKQQLDGLGEQVYGRKISKEGYENFWPRFSGDGKKVYFLSNGKNDYGFKKLYTVELSDSVDEKKRIKPVGAIGSFYDLHPPSGRLCFVSPHSRKSIMPARLGGNPTRDLFTDTIPPEKPGFRLFFKKTEQQITEKQSIFSAAFSPDGSRLACAKRSADLFSLGITDTGGKHFTLVYPPKDSAHLQIRFIYSLDWSPDGKRIAFSFFDRHDRKIGLFDTANGSCTVLCDTDHDERDPAFSPDGGSLYFSSDRTGIFNLYRYEFATGKLQRITNVTGGAFAPSVAPDGKRVVYAGYDAAGYGIYLLDTVRALSDTVITEAAVPRRTTPQPSYHVALQEARRYNYLPRQALLVPTVLTEQAVSRSDNVNRGVSAFKMGLIFNLLDPLTLSDLGNELGGYFFLEPKRLFSFINPDHQGINVAANYDFGLYGVTRMLPLTLSGEYLVRGIAGVDWFFNETEGAMENDPYRIDLQNFNLQLSHFLDGDYEFGGIPKNQLAVHLLGGMNRYDVNLLLKAYNLPVFKYNLSKGYRIGSLGTYSSAEIEPTRSIAPRGTVAKLQYDFWNQYSLKEENSFEYPSLKERYNTYLFHQFMGHTKLGIGAPWSKKQSLHANLQGTLLQVLKQDTSFFPSYYLPGAWIPGYAYYRRDTRIVQTEANPASEQRFDTLLVTGRAVINGELSYRFPLSPKLIDKKFWFLYFKRVYGVGNFNFGAGWDNPSDFFNYNRDDWLLAYGLEVRLEAITFNTYPLALKLRWDYGADRPAPLGGHRFTFSIGYDFDNWGLILVPDYRQSSLFAKGL
ncbi:MAG: PD40 domain-containing protein [Chitinispirillaceae bacterium]|nr:PD40 domain-containing protein [Chitinispirillaceae bacterium]